MSLNEKYPYLTAWLGYAAIFLVIGFILGAITRGFPFGSVIVLFALPITSFIAFEFIIKRHLVAEDKLSTNSTPTFFWTWLVITILGLILNIIILRPLALVFANPILFRLEHLSLWLFANFFIFKFAVKKYIVYKFNSKSFIESTIVQNTDEHK